MLSTVLIIDKRKELSTKYKKSLESPEITAIIASTLKDAMVNPQVVIGIFLPIPVNSSTLSLPVS